MILWYITMRSQSHGKGMLMKVFRTILTAIACFLIAVGIFSVLGYQLYFRYAKPEVPAQTTVQQAPEAETEPEPEAEPQPEPEAEPEPSEDEVRARELLADLTLEQKLYQLCFVTPESLTGVEAATKAGDATKEALQSNPVGGLIYDEKNIEDKDQLKDLLTGTQDYLKDGDQFPAFLAIGEEGGDVAPVAAKLDLTTFGTMAELGVSEDLDGAYSMGSIIAMDLSELGFNVDFAPIADLTDSDSNPVIGSRSFGPDADLTASLVASVVNGIQSNHMLSAVSHFPGLGSISDVAHVDRTRITRSLEDLKGNELLPFQSAADSRCGFVIVSHAVLTELDDQRPCSMSPAVMQLLREDLGYQGIILTDTLSVPAITDHYDSGEAALNAIDAGADMLLCPADLEQTIETLQKAVDENKLTEERIDESVARILAAKLRLGLIE